MLKYSPTLVCIFLLNSDFKSNKEIYFETILNSALSLEQFVVYIPFEGSVNSIWRSRSHFELVTEETWKKYPKLSH